MRKKVTVVGGGFVGVGRGREYPSSDNALMFSNWVMAYERAPSWARRALFVTGLTQTVVFIPWLE